MYRSLSEFINILSKHNELIRISEYVNPELEITEIVDRESKKEGGGKAILFENTGTEFPVLINAFGSLKRICLALGVNDLDDIGKEIEVLFQKISSPKDNLFDKLKVLPLLNELASWMPKSIKGKGKCQEVVSIEPDLSKIPVLKCWPADGGPFITLPMVNTKDPVSGIRNVGMYRIQIFDKDLTGMHWHMHKTGARHYEEYKKLGKKMPVAIALGGDPIYTYSATAPLPDNIDEYMLAGFLRKKKVELVKCITQDIEVPSDADFIIEGYIDPQEDLIWEGPFGDHTGFYSLADWYPRFHVTCITHRKDAVYPATIVGIPPQEDAFIGKATERIFLKPIQYSMLPEIKDLDLPYEGVAHNIVIVKIEKSFPGQAQKVMNTLWGAGQMMFSKIIVVVDQDVDIHDYTELLSVVSENYTPVTDTYFFSGPADVLDHAASEKALGGKIGIDATRKLNEELNNTQNKIIVKEVNEGLNLDCITAVNSKHIESGSPILFISVDKVQADNLFNLAMDFLQLNGHKAKLCVIVDKQVDLTDTGLVTWLLGGNVDPTRDCKVVDISETDSCLIVNATRKSMKKDNFKRDWPNIVTMSEDIIKQVDERWNSIMPGEFMESPSLKYAPLKLGNDAVIED